MDLTTDVPCINIHTVNASDQCRFFNETKDCQDSDGKLDYMFFIFCVFQEQTALGVFLCVLWLLLLFIALGVTADDFLCPSLVVITRTLHLSQNIAGVTFLAFGNGAPDIFSAVAGIEQMRPQLVIGTLFGAGIFVTSVVAGSIIVSRPFQIMERPFLRDIIFYICATFWAFLRFYYGEISLGHSIGFVALYMLYIVVVIVSRVVYNKYRTKRKASAIEDGKTTVATIPAISVEESMERTESQSSRVTFNTDPEVDDPEAEGVVLRRFSFRSSLQVQRKRSSCHSHHEHVLKTLTNNVDNHPNPAFRNASGQGPPPLDTQLSKTSLSSLLSKASSWDRPNLAKDFFRHACPIDVESWPERKWYSKVLDVLKSPVRFLLIVTVPVVDYENERSNWCRILNSLHCITAPMFVLVAVGEYDQVIDEVVPVWAVVLGSSALLAVIVFFTSTASEPPCYHWVYGYIGFATSVMWVYLVASEIVSLLKAIGIVFRLSDAILGLTVLAWGNSIGDFISNLSVARQGYPRMGISACYGGPLLNLLLGIGIPYTVKIASTGKPLELEFTRLISLLYGTLTLVLLSSLLTMTVLRFNAKRYFGIFLLACYGVFVTAAVLLETNIV